MRTRFSQPCAMQGRWDRGGGGGKNAQDRKVPSEVLGLHEERGRCAKTAKGEGAGGGEEKRTNATYACRKQKVYINHRET